VQLVHVADPNDGRAAPAINAAEFLRRRAIASSRIQDANSPHYGRLVFVARRVVHPAKHLSRPGVRETHRRMGLARHRRLTDELRAVQNYPV
jgi:hypothetical protein